MRTTTFPFGGMLSKSTRVFVVRRFREAFGLSLIFLTAALGIALATWSVGDPSLNHATDAQVRNAFGFNGAIVADLVMQLIGVSSIALLAPLALLGWRLLTNKSHFGRANPASFWIIGMASAAAVSSFLPATDRWPLPTGLGGVIGDAIVALPKRYFSSFGLVISALILLVVAILSLTMAAGFGSPFGETSDESLEEIKDPQAKRPYSMPGDYHRKQGAEIRRGRAQFLRQSADCEFLFFRCFLARFRRHRC